MNKFGTLTATVLATALVACGGSSSSQTTTDAGTDAGTGGFKQPAGTNAVNFSIDDTLNRQWKSGELEWKGNVLFDSATRIGTYDSTWGGPWARLYDDGPWDTGGHEPKGAVAGDHKLGVTVFIAPPATGTQKYEYGLRDATNTDTANGGWVWVGSNGSFTLTANDLTDKTAAGIAFPAHGAIDLKLTLDTNNLDSGGTWDASKVQVKGSGWGWGDVTMYDDGTHGDTTSGDKVFTFLLSAAIDQTKPPYPGLLKAGDQAEFVFDLGPTGSVKEYKVSSVCSKQGVRAYLIKAGVSTEVTSAIGVTGGTGLGSGNTYVTAN